MESETRSLPGVLVNCGGCGTLLEPTEEQINKAVDGVLTASLADAHKSGGICPLCGHSQEVPFWNRKTVLFGLLAGCLLFAVSILLLIHHVTQTDRSKAIAAAMLRLQQNETARQLLGTPLTVEPGVEGDVTHDETGWTEARLSIPVRGPKGEAMLKVTGGRAHDTWTFSELEVVIEAQRKKVDLITGRLELVEPGAYVDVHTQVAQRPEYERSVPPAPMMDGSYPCVVAPVTGGSVAASLGRCQTPTGQIPTGQAQRLDQFSVDLRYGSFVLQQSDLVTKGAPNILLTRSYRSDDWLCRNRSHAFGRNANHPYDIAPLGTRNPYTYLDLVLEDGEFLHFERISKGTGYANAVYQHSETSTRFYKATISWNGLGWTLILADGSRMEFPESYNASNLAQGAPNMMEDSAGNKLVLRRDRQRRLLAIEAAGGTVEGTAVRFSYDEQARIVRAQDEHGGSVHYTYRDDGFLGDAVFSSGTARHYGYENSLMTTVMDEHGRTLVRNTYEKGQVVRQEFAGGQVFEYDYQLAPSGTYNETVVVTLPDGSTKEIRVDGVPESVRRS